MDQRQHYCYRACYQRKHAYRGRIHVLALHTGDWTGTPEPAHYDPDTTQQHPCT